ncbi:hypothetical protein GGH94_006280 [Coemansia aciculifera]|uniref:Uncharacterized protein n=2 Tax=Coemansia TaxID=4863 RepID=A0A9W8L902_9FUNG|nr:hypothetical protein GGI19_005800 [Coemansia pectinata]KAJ2859114.1 hypothetical protein GGH94_006280 [Coemansia aciculifera]KAJ2879273.1 hypothetical protein H4R27_005404 [Coemansia aciculifera]
MGQSGSKTLARKTLKGGMRLPRTSQPPAAKTREEILGEDAVAKEDEDNGGQMAANLKRFLNPRQHTTMTGMAPAKDNTNVQALRQRQACDAGSRVESQQISKLLRDLGSGMAVERVAGDYKLDVATARSLHAFLTPVT